MCGRLDDTSGGRGGGRGAVSTCRSGHAETAPRFGWAKGWQWQPIGGEVFARERMAAPAGQLCAPTQRRASRRGVAFAPAVRASSRADGSAGVFAASAMAGRRRRWSLCSPAGGKAAREDPDAGVDLVWQKQDQKKEHPAQEAAAAAAATPEAASMYQQQKQQQQRPGRQAGMAAASSEQHTERARRWNGAACRPALWIRRYPAHRGLLLAHTAFLICSPPADPAVWVVGSRALGLGLLV